MDEASGEKPMNKRRLLIIIVIVVAVVAVAILLDTLLANHRPAIASLEAQPERVIPWGSCQIACNASDADGDVLSYNWSASGGEIGGEGTEVTWSAPGSAGSYNVTVAVTDGRGGEVMGHVIITVRVNRAPTITSLITDAHWIIPPGTIQVTCTASDPDDDELSYVWSTDGGNISGTGRVVNWTAPEQVGVYNITALAKDGHGRSDSNTLPISVVTGQPPNIEALLVTAEHCYLKTYSWGYKVGIEREYYIECDVTEADSDLLYDWSCEDGTISGEGSMITWTAPDKYLEETTVTVVVSDIVGNMVVKNLLLKVLSCTACAFPGCTG
jgi:hypothetical protein